MLMGAFFGAWGADMTGSWVLGVGHRACSRAAVFGLVHALFAVSLRADQIVSRHRAEPARRSASPATCTSTIYGDQGTPDDLPHVPDVTCRSSRSR